MKNLKHSNLTYARSAAIRVFEVETRAALLELGEFRTFAFEALIGNRSGMIAQPAGPLRFDFLAVLRRRRRRNLGYFSNRRSPARK